MKNIKVYINPFFIQIKQVSSSNEMFITVKNAFDNQQYVINSKVADKDYNQLKQDYTEYSQLLLKKKSQFF